MLLDASRALSSILARSRREAAAARPQSTSLLRGKKITLIRVGRSQTVKENKYPDLTTPTYPINASRNNSLSTLI